MASILYKGKQEIVGGSETDPYASNVVLLSYCNKHGAGFTDETGKAVSIAGSGSIALYNPSNIGLIYFPGNFANYGQLAANQSDFWFGSGDWTMEFYVSSPSWYNGASYFGAIFFVQRNPSDQFGIQFDYYNNNLRLFGNGSNNLNFAFTPSNETGYLIAVCRDGNDIKCAVDGVQVGVTQSWAGVTLDDVTSFNRFGGDSYNAHGIVQFHGIRITKGIARNIFDPDSLPWAYL